jgi:hypothetical protein
MSVSLFKNDFESKTKWFLVESDKEAKKYMKWYDDDKRLIKRGKKKRHKALARKQELDIKIKYDDFMYFYSSIAMGMCNMYNKIKGLPPPELDNPQLVNIGFNNGVIKKKAEVILDMTMGIDDPPKAFREKWEKQYEEITFRVGEAYKNWRNFYEEFQGIMLCELDTIMEISDTSSESSTEEETEEQATERQREIYFRLWRILRSHNRGTTPSQENYEILERHWYKYRRCLFRITHLIFWRLRGTN